MSHPAAQHRAGARFAALQPGKATLSPADLSPPRLEPPASRRKKTAEHWAKQHGMPK